VVEDVAARAAPVGAAPAAMVAAEAAAAGVNPDLFFFTAYTILFFYTKNPFCVVGTSAPAAMSGYCIG